MLRLSPFLLELSIRLLCTPTSGFGALLGRLGGFLVARVPLVLRVEHVKPDGLSMDGSGFLVRAFGALVRFGYAAGRSW